MKPSPPPNRLGTKASLPVKLTEGLCLPVSAGALLFGFDAFLKHRSKAFPIGDCAHPRIARSKTAPVQFDPLLKGRYFPP
jgi:hypothetical protein